MGFPNSFQIILIVLAGVSATLSSFLSFKHICTENSRKRIRNNAVLVTKEQGGAKSSFSVDKFACKEMERQSCVLAVSKDKFIAKGMLSKSKGLDRLIRLSGSVDKFSVKGILNARIYLAIYFGAAGFVLGLLFTTELALLLCVVAAFYGFGSPKRILKAKAKERGEALEKHLPQMLDVISIGMRSGLSFDRSLQIYAKTFESALSRDFLVAQQMWTSGLKSREDALRDLSEVYDSQIFSRMIESIIRSLKLGSSMIDSLSASAAESRAVYRERREERVRKAPIKMMIPTGTLILPAMLILVLGPVMLQLMSGGGL